MLRFELGKVTGTEKFIKLLAEKYPKITPQISHSELTYTVEQVLMFLQAYRLEYVIAHTLLDQFEKGERDNIELHVYQRKQKENVAIGHLQFNLSYGDSPYAGHNLLRAWSRFEFDRVMTGTLRR